MGLFDNFPYTNFHELNLDWMLNALRELEHTINDFVAINALKYADPIQWNITSQYEKNTIVIDPQTGTAYISVQPVPAGISLTNTDYWTVVFDLSSFVVKAAKNLSNRVEENTNTATFNSVVGDWLILYDVLYVVTNPINAGDAYVIGSNIERITIEDIIGHLDDLETIDKTSIVNAINELIHICGDLDNLSTTDKSNLVSAINEICTIIGSLASLKTADKTSIVNAINELYDIRSDSKAVFMPVNKNVPYATYASGDCTVFITKSNKVIMIDTGAPHSWTDIHDELQNLEITHVDYFILTHFHWDHYGNLQDLIDNNYITADTVCYLPRYAGIVVPGIDDEAGVRAMLAFAVNVTISSTEPLIVDGMEFDFFNCDDSDYTHHNTNNYAYNDYSVCCYVTYGNLTILMAADLMSNGQLYCLNAGYIHKCDILKIPHHGMPDGVYDFYIAAQPTYGIVSVCYNDIKRDIFDYNQIRYCTIFNIVTYACGNAPIYVGISDSIYSVLSDALQIRSGINTAVKLYVNQSNADYGDGSSTNPFNDIRSALALASTFNTNATIIVEVQGSYTYNGNLTLFYMPSKLQLTATRVGGVNQMTVNGKLSVQGSNVDISNVNFVFSGEGIAADCYQSRVLFSNCEFSGEQKTGSEGNQRCINSNLSDVQLNDCTISDKGVMMVALNGNIYASGVSGSSNTRLCGGGNGRLMLHSINASYTTLIGYADINLVMNIDNNIGYQSYGEFMAFRSAVTGAPQTKTFDFSDSHYQNIQITVKAKSGSEYKINRIGAGTLSAVEQIDTGTLIAQTVSVSTSGYTLTITHDLDVEIFVRK